MARSTLVAVAVQTVTHTAALFQELAVMEVAEMVLCTTWPTAQL
jgi:hypothetical protein